ncbi:YciC family protein [Tatumella saanichensis]|uniref:YciC family protein n=1 Tax=Tatumella saanichensis TaxID=480813 RepID=UPI0004A31BF7|nr:YciC family protein [Tatumella saanichensis]
MSLTASSLYRDTANFLRHQSKTIVLISLVSAFVTVILGTVFAPGADQLSLLSQNSDNAGSLIELIQSMSPEQQRVLLHSSAVGTLSALIGNTLLLGGMLVLLPAVSAGKHLSALSAIGGAVGFLPSLLIQTFLVTLIAQLGFMVLIVPGVILTILFSLSPVLLSQKQGGIIGTMKQSVSLGWKNIRVLAPAVICWLLGKVVLIMVLSSLTRLPVAFSSLIVTTLGNLLSAVLITYLFRAFMLLR